MRGVEQASWRPLVGRPWWQQGVRLDGPWAVRSSDGGSVLGGGVGVMSSDPGGTRQGPCWGPVGSEAQLPS